MSQRSIIPFFVKSFVVLLLLAGAGYFLWMRSRPTFQVERAERGKAVSAVTGSVVVREEIPTVVRSPLSGLVAEAKLEVGAAVKVGDFLVQIDTGDVDLEIQAIEDSVKALREKMKAGSEVALQLRLAELDFANQERSFKGGNLAPNEFKKAEIALDGAKLRAALEVVNNEAQLAALGTQLAAKKRQKEKMTIRSPVDGQIAEATARKGNLVTSESVLLTIISNTRTVEAKIPEENFAGVEVGRHASVRFLRFGGQEYGAAVSKVLPIADPLTQRRVVFLNVDLPPEKLDPGLTGEVAIVVGVRENALIIPRRAYFSGKVFVVKDGVVELRAVSVGYVSLNAVEITKGLTEGEWVLVENLDLVRAGDRVRVQIGEQRP